VKAVVLDAETVPFIDVTAAQTLAQLRGDLERDGVRLLVARDVGQVRDVLRREDGEHTVYPSVEDAVSRAR
jgi:MFS superfamily sulfate permease-like transporter